MNHNHCVLGDRDGILAKLIVYSFLQSQDGMIYLIKFLLQSRGQVPSLTGLVIFLQQRQAVKGKNYVPEVPHASKHDHWTDHECWFNLLYVNRLTNEVLASASGRLKTSTNLSRLYLKRKAATLIP